MGVRTTNNVEAILDARGSSKRWLAKQLGMHDTQLNKYLSGALPAPADLYDRIAKVLQVPVTLLKPRADGEPAEVAA